MRKLPFSLDKYKLVDVPKAKIKEKRRVLSQVQEDVVLSIKNLFKKHSCDGVEDEKK